MAIPQSSSKQFVYANVTWAIEVVYERADVDSHGRDQLLPFQSRCFRKDSAGDQPSSQQATLRNPTEFQTK